MSRYLTIRVTEGSFERALQALRFEIALATAYPSRHDSGDMINGMRRSLYHPPDAGRRADERAGRVGRRRGAREGGVRLQATVGRLHVGPSRQRQRRPAAHQEYVISALQ